MSDVIGDAELYNSDFFAWTKVQAEKLRRLQAARDNIDLDLPRLAEEVEDLGKAERDAVRSQIRRIIEHCLKLQYSPATAPAIGRKDSIMGARAQLEDKLTETLRRDIELNLERLYARARERAENALREHGEAEAAASLPSRCPYPLSDLIQHGWYPPQRPSQAI